MMVIITVTYGLIRDFIQPPSPSSSNSLLFELAKLLYSNIMSL